ncbi:hypothetical protein D3C78_1500170 [compost metagenome]
MPGDVLGVSTTPLLLGSTLQDGHQFGALASLSHLTDDPIALHLDIPLQLDNGDEIRLARCHTGLRSLMCFSQGSTLANWPSRLFSARNMA